MKDLRKYINELRYDFTNKILDESDVNENPFVQFEHWFKDAVESGTQCPNAMVVSTSSKDGKPTARVLLLRNFSEEGYVFYTNYHSKKALHLRENPLASLTFFWPEEEKQIRIEGQVEKQNDKDSDEYFDVRPDGSKLGAWSSPQSSIIENRSFLVETYANMQKKFKGKEIPRPPFWGGYILKPNYFEFWQGRPSRMHDRIVYELNNSGQWDIKRLAP